MAKSRKRYVCPICGCSPSPATHSSPAESCDCDTSELPELPDEDTQFDTRRERLEYYEGIENDY